MAVSYQPLHSTQATYTDALWYIRLLNEPRPEVVGIGWVVESVEKRTKVDEVKFRVDLELMNVAGTNKVGYTTLLLYAPSYIPLHI
jgi:beta-xylosidase